MELDLLPGESRGYWKYHAPTKWFRQAKASGKVNNDHANLLFDTGAEISILDIAFARKVGCQMNDKNVLVLGNPYILRRGALASRSL